MPEHRDLTGASLHEPKGCAAATSGQVYVADGAGSGVWSSRLGGINNLNSFSLNGQIDDISTASSNAYFYIDRACNLVTLSGVLYGAITVANSILSIYRDGILLAPTLTVAFSGSGAGVKSSLALSPAVGLTAGQSLEIRSNGGSTDVAKFSLTLTFVAT